MITKKRNYLYDGFIICIMLNSLGFPGNFKLVLGDGIGTVIDYSCFFMEIFLLLFTSADRIYDIKLLDFRKECSSIYFFILYTVVDSMFMAVSAREEVITMVRLCVTVLFAIWISRSMSVERIVELLCYAHTVFVIATLLFTLLYPSMAFRTYESGTDFIGLGDAKNVCATELALGAVMIVLHYRICRDQKKRINISFVVCLAVSIILLISSKGVGAWITAAIAIAYILYAQEKVAGFKRIQIGWIFIIVSFSFLAIAITILPVFSDLFELLGKDATLTGRVPLWNYALRMMSENHPLTGYGYGMFWRNEKAVALIQAGFSSDSFLGNLTTGSHNLFIEMWMSIGLIGVMLFIFMVLNCTKKCYEIETDAYLFVCAFFIVFTIKGLTERMLSAAYTYDVQLLFISLALACTKRINKKPVWKRLHCQSRIDENKEVESR